MWHLPKPLRGICWSLYVHLLKPLCGIYCSLYVAFAEASMWHLLKPLRGICWSLYVAFAEASMWHLLKPLCGICSKPSCGICWSFLCGICTSLYMASALASMWHLQSLYEVSARSFYVASALHRYGVATLVGSLKLLVSFVEYLLFYRALLQERPIIWRSLLIVAFPVLFESPCWKRPRFFEGSFCRASFTKGT